MASVSPSGGYYSSLVANNKGIGGLASGLNTDEIIEAMTMNTRNRLAKQGQMRQLALWQQTAYRTTHKTLSAFKDKYFSFTSSTNLTSQGFYNSLKANYVSDKVKVTTTANSSMGKIEIKAIKSIATAQSVKGLDITTKLEGGDIATGYDKDEFVNKRLTLNVDGTVKTMDLTSLSTKTTVDDAVAELQNIINSTFGTKISGAAIVEATKTPAGGILLENSSGRVTVVYDCDVLKLEKSQTNRMDINKAIKDVIPGLENRDKFSININGTELEFSANDTVSNMMSKINASAAGVRMTYSTVTNEFVMTSTKTGAGSYIQMNDIEGNLFSKIFGTAGSHKITSEQRLHEAGKEVTGDAIDWSSKTVEELKEIGEYFTKAFIAFNVNGVAKNIKIDFSTYAGLKTKFEDGTFDNSDLGLIETALNDSLQAAYGTGPGCPQFAYDPATKKFTLEMGDNDVTMLAPGSTSIAGALGFSGTVTNTYDFTNKKEIPAGAISISDLTAMFDTANAGANYNFKLTINGTAYDIKYELTQSDIDEFDELDTDEKKYQFLASKLNAAIYKEAGEAAGYLNGSNVVMMVGFECDSSGNFKLATSQARDVELGVGSSIGTDIALDTVLGFIPADNLSDAFKNTTLAQLGLASPTTGNLSIELSKGGTPVNIAIDSSMMLQQLVEKFENQFGKDQDILAIKNGKLVIKGDNNYLKISGTGTGGDLLNKLFGITGSFETSDPHTDYATNFTQGTNAEIEILKGTNTIVISQASNTISIDGVNIEVLATTNDAITIDVVSDPQNLVDEIKKFIEDYNALLTTLNSTINEKTDAAYKPLTDEQRAGMSATEIEKWEVEAKKGLLRNDSTIRNILSDMRLALLGKVESAGLTLGDLGISTMSPLASGYDNTKAGHLIINNEDRLKTVIENRPESVRLLFTDDTNGLAVALNKAIDKAVNTDSSDKKRGSLVRLAGTDALTANNTSSLGRKIESYDKAIAALKTKLENEYNRYWKQFSKLEMTISRLSAQSSWLYDFQS